VQRARGSGCLIFGEVETLAEYVQGTRYDWKELLEGNPLRDRVSGDFRSAINVLTAIDKLEKSSSEFGGVRRVYDFLSDFCHPNMGNQLLVTEDSGAESDEIIVAELPNAPFFELVIWKTIPAVTACLRRIVQVMDDGFKIYEHWKEHVVGTPWQN